MGILVILLHEVGSTSILVSLKVNLDQQPIFMVFSAPHIGNGLYFKNSCLYHFNSKCGIDPCYIVGHYARMSFKKDNVVCGCRVLLS